MQNKSEMINRIAELAEENAKLKGKLDAFQMSENEANETIAELKAENERLKSENEAYDREQYYYYNLSEDYKQTLQEIRAIAMVIDTAECRERRKNARKIIDLITKAEEE